MLLPRVLTAVVLLVVLVGAALWAPDFWFDGLLLLIVCLGYYEWLRLLYVRPARAVSMACALGILGVLGLLAFPSIIAAANGIGGAVTPVYLLATLVWIIGVPIALTQRRSMGGQNTVGQMVAFMLCVSTWIALIQADGLGKPFLLSVLLLVWVADTAAYFAGRAFGRRRLAPAISPGKTWEGVVGAVVGNLVLAVLFAAWIPVGPDNPAGSLFHLIAQSAGWPFLVGLVVLVTLVGVVGDLYESLLKRLCGVKDSGHLLPGHGGVLDRIDALMAVFPVTMGIVSLIQLGLIGV